MRRKDFIQVFEHQKLKYGEDAIFKKHHFDSMVQFNEKNKNKYFTIIFEGVLFNSYVGVIQIGGLTIEILPKADRSESADKNTWQNVLLDMLGVCKHLPIDSVSETSLKKRHNSILDIYFGMFLDEIEILSKNGLIKKYGRLQSNRLALKGKLVFSKNIQKNIIHKERFYCEHQIYDKDHLTHQILYRGLIILKDLLNNDLKDKLNRLLFEFQDFKEIIVNKNHFDKVVLTRRTLPYKKALDISKMIILNYSPNLSTGTDKMLTLLFDMNRLWEEYIYRILQRHKPVGYNVSFQNSDKFWEHKSIRPDIVITNSSGENFVIDTKWKIIDPRNPSDADLKQMFIYNLHWNAPSSMLLYPRIDQVDKQGTFHYYQLDKKCKVGFVDITEANMIKNAECISEEIFNKIKLDVSDSVQYRSLEHGS